MEFFPPDWNPDQNKSTNYLSKFPEGETRIRILSKPIVGWKDWDDSINKPVRFKPDARPAKSLSPDRDIQGFSAFIVWNYTEGFIQIAEITQATIRKPLRDLIKDKDWGMPFYYDIKVVKSIDAKAPDKRVGTSYSVFPVAPKPLDEFIKKEFFNVPIYLEALYENQDPFADHGKRTKAFFEEEGEESKDGLLSVSQLEQIGELIGENLEIVNRILKYYQVDKLAKVPSEKFDELLAMAQKASNKGGK